MSSSWFCGCGFCSALSLTLPFTLALPVLPLHAAGGGGTRAPVVHSHWGGSELREATLHPGKPLCLRVRLFLVSLLCLTCSVMTFSGLSSSPFLPFVNLSPHCDISPSSTSFISAPLFLLPFLFASLRSDLSLSIMQSNYQRHILFDYGNHFNHEDDTSAGDSAS